MAEFNFPWGGTYWLAHHTGIAKKVKVDKRNKIYTTTHHTTHSTTGFDYATGRLVSGSVSVPHTEVHSELEIETSFWIDSGNGNQKHYEFKHEVIPILEGQKISIVWGAKSGVDSGLYKCLYNHVTGDVYTFPRSFSDLGLVYLSKGGLLYLYMWLFIIFLIMFIFNLFYAFSSNHRILLDAVGGSCMFLGGPAAVFYMLYKKRFNSWKKNNYDIKQKVINMRNSIIEYVKTL